MDVDIRLEGDDAAKKAANLKEYIESKYLPGLETVHEQRAPVKPGEQGLGTLIGGLLVKLSGGDNVIKEFLTTLQKWADLLDQRIHLGNGVIIPGKKLSGDQIVEIIAIINKKGDATK